MPEAEGPRVMGYGVFQAPGAQRGSGDRFMGPGESWSQLLSFPPQDSLALPPPSTRLSASGSTRMTMMISCSTLDSIWTQD